MPVATRATRANNGTDPGEPEEPEEVEEVEEAEGAEEVGFDPRRSQVSDNALASFIRSPITGDITEVPGIKAKAAGILAEGEGEDCVTNTYQLIGKYLALRGPDNTEQEVDSVEHCDKFWHWLKSKGINAHRGSIVRSLAEKVNTWIPGIYDGDRYIDY